MAIFCKLFAIFLLSAAELAYSQTSDSEQTALPPLPMEERDPEPSKLFDEGEQINSGLFTDTSSSKGLPRYFNVLDLSGYLRFRPVYFRNAHLSTYIPELKGGSSLFPPNLSFIGREANENQTEDNPAQNNFSANMRLRLDPTINISQSIRVRSTFDIFDNMVLGSTPSNNPGSPLSMMSLSQSSFSNAIAVKRAWGEASFAIGELRFGRMPFHWGMGVLYNSGDDVGSDYGDQIDGIMFTTRIFDHYFTPAYSISYVGPISRGGGQFSTQNDFQSLYLPSESGQRYPLEASDLTHVFMLSFLKRESEFIVNKKMEEGRSIFDYGVFASYRRQFLDSQNISPNGFSFDALNKSTVKRNGNIGLASLWSSFSYKTFHIENEFAGHWGKYQIGEKATDLMAKKDDGSVIAKRDVWLLGGGFALQSRYGFLNDRLQLGLDGGWASSQEGPGFGVREGSKLDPVAGDADGRKLPEEGTLKTNFKFNPAYTVDLLLHKEILGTVSSTAYFKPHLSYFFSQNFGLRSDIITTVAPSKSNTPGNSNWLGVEFDGSAFLRTDNGFYFSMAYGLLVPLKGLNLQKTSAMSTQQFDIFQTARVAQTIQLFLGLIF